MQTPRRVPRGKATIGGTIGAVVMGVAWAGAAVVILVVSVARRVGAWVRSRGTAG
ncbi:MAG: hypothetical protein FWF02_06500 [Micrococcales bacterium]|nr:hypothetical protein [Micrococcales bacterium]MCL2667341.1 hypothetical protein [Micrococcales bacterium]